MCVCLLTLHRRWLVDLMLAVVKIRLYSMQATVLIDLLPTAIDPFSNSVWNFFLNLFSSSRSFSFLSADWRFAFILNVPSPIYLLLVGEFGSSAPSSSSR